MSENHLTPSERREYENALSDLRHYRRKAQQCQSTVRRIKDVARKRAQKAKQPCV